MTTVGHRTHSVPCLDRLTARSVPVRSTVGANRARDLATRRRNSTGRPSPAPVAATLTSITIRATLNTTTATATAMVPAPPATTADRVATRHYRRCAGAAARCSAARAPRRPSSIRRICRRKGPPGALGPHRSFGATCAAAEAAAAAAAPTAALAAGTTAAAPQPSRPSVAADPPKDCLRSPAVLSRTRPRTRWRARFEPSVPFVLLLFRSALSIRVARAPPFIHRSFRLRPPGPPSKRRGPFQQPTFVHWMNRPLPPVSEGVRRHLLGAGGNHDLRKHLDFHKFLIDKHIESHRGVAASTHCRSAPCHRRDVPLRAAPPPLDAAMAYGSHAPLPHFFTTAASSVPSKTARVRRAPASPTCSSPSVGPSRSFSRACVSSLATITRLRAHAPPKHTLRSVRPRRVPDGVPVHTGPVWPDDMRDWTVWPVCTCIPDRR